MPDLGSLLGGLVAFIGEQVGASSLRLGPIATVTLLTVMLVILSLVARPSTRWTVRDLGRLASVGRAMALAAESGGVAAFSLGTAGVARATSSLDRLQTLAGIGVLSVVARAAARSGVPLRVTSNDAVAAGMARAVLDDAHRRTETLERRSRSSAEYLGEGRATAAATALARGGSPAASFAAGGLAEEGLLLLYGASRGAASSSFGTAAPSQASSVLLTGEGTMIGPELFQATSDIRGRADRTGVLAANRLLLVALAVIALGSLLAWVAGVDVTTVLAGA
ncbi:MAG TPA: DUF6754 domain-containing protein [Candidatus Limnocylindria bacterium]|nr:DUF6754 domain-containing protein [Candidatus Limnocylindria bacterium]